MNKHVLLALLLVGCSGSDAPPTNGPDGPDGGDGSGSSTPMPDAPMTSYAGVTCATPPPAGAPTPPPLPQYAGTCPTLVAGMNTIVSSGVPRKFVLVVPSALDTQTETLPLLFMWHYIGGSASSMVNNGDAQPAADELRMLIAVPEKKGDVLLPIANVDLAWPYMDFVTNARVEQEAVLFDDILACVAQQFPVQEQCVSSVGVSAGALWTAQLMQRRSSRLSSAIVISGGVGPTGGFGGFADVRGWTGSERPIPTIYGWGGSTDSCGGVSFEAGSHALGSKLEAQGSFVVECVHNCGHAAPPVDPMVGLRVLYKFVLDHPYWLPAGASPWTSTGLPTGTPEWCGIGVGGATPRTGSCTGVQSCPL